MARTNRQSTDTLKVSSVKELLFKEPYRFEFHQAIKLLEQIFHEKVPLGESVEPREEAVSVKARVFLESMSSDIFQLEPHPQSTKRALMHINFMGLSGIQGPLPFPYTEMIIHRLRNGDHSLVDFLDIFNHRLISILHRARKQYHLGLNTLTPDKTIYGQALQAFSGISLEPLQHRLSLKDRGLLYYAGLFWSQNKPSLGLTQIVSNYFGLPVRIESCVGRWRIIEPDQQTRLGKGGQWNLLGRGATMGMRAWDQQSHFQLHLGPIDGSQLKNFLPVGNNFHILNDIIRFYVPLQHDYRLHYEVDKKHLPLLKLGKSSYLGWHTWLVSNKMKRKQAGLIDRQLKITPSLNFRNNKTGTGIKLS